MEMIKLAVSGSVDGAMSKAGLPELRSDFEVLKEKVDIIDCEISQVREANVATTISLSHSRRNG